jgi:hypothetical protein
VWHLAAERRFVSRGTRCKLNEQTHNIYAILDPSHQMLKVGIELLQAARVEEHPALSTSNARSTGGAGGRLGRSAVSMTSYCCFRLMRSLCGQLLLLAEDLELGVGEAKSSIRY